MTTCIWWIRRDLRLTDNQALTAALASSAHVIPLFIIDPKLINSPYNSPRRSAFLWEGLLDLGKELRERGSGLVIRYGQPVEELVKLAAEAGATSIYAERDHSPYAVKRDSAVGQRLQLHLTDGVTIRPIDCVLKQDGTPYTVFTPYSLAWKRHRPIERPDILPAPQRLPELPALSSIGLEQVKEHIQTHGNLLSSGEHAAKEVLTKFLNRQNGSIYTYASQRDLPDIEGTSGLSPYLRFGMVSPRLAALAAYESIGKYKTGLKARSEIEAEERSGPEVWLDELIWRDFYTTILAYFPTVRQQSFRPQYDKIVWANDESDYDAWCHGKTGYPLVDAAMRQLLQSGWMHNRARMVVSSFLVKDLLIDWRWGERWFMQQLLDGDPAANNGGWQWVAGTGTDAAPYFRIFNPIAQGKKFDKEGNYIRRWVSELAQVPRKYIHEPWLMPKSEQIRASVSIGDGPNHDYPFPIVDHKWARERTLAAYKKATGKA